MGGLKGQPAAVCQWSGQLPSFVFCVMWQGYEWWNEKASSCCLSMEWSVD